MAASPSDGGWSFALDPDASAEEAPALWHPRDCGLVTIAEPAPTGFAAAPLDHLLAAGPVAAEVIAHREWHLVLLIDGRRHRLSLRHFAGNESFACSSPADAHRALRADMTATLFRRLDGRPEPRHSACGVPGPTERWRLVQWLRLLDALGEAPPARDLAASLLTEDARASSSIEWDASSERRRIARWRRAAVAMRDGGYRSLLSDR